MPLLRPVVCMLASVQRNQISKLDEPDVRQLRASSELRTFAWSSAGSSRPINVAKSPLPIPFCESASTGRQSSTVCPSETVVFFFRWLFCEIFT